MNNLTILMQTGESETNYVCDNQFAMPNNLKGLADLFMSTEQKYGIELPKWRNILSSTSELKINTNKNEKPIIGIYAIHVLNALKTYEIQTWQIKAFIAFLRNIPKKTYLFLYWH